MIIYSKNPIKILKGGGSGLKINFKNDLEITVTVGLKVHLVR